ncbi:MAG: hypothetical protein ACI9P5_000072 [Saprospiraceae bacterium]|jgi:hypothetical protein|tara:strand:+ start:1009 stop:1302 length:294 start_codon:yes stop_codon:yes gene_type:complete
MKEEKNIWIDSVMNSHVGREVLVPDSSLFDRIILQTTKVKTISLRQMGMVGIAASVLLLINVIALQNINTPTTWNASDIAYENEVQLISDYNLYGYE